MNIKRPLMPGFLKRAEQKLLLNKPGIWSTRVHLVLYYGILFLLLLTILCFLEPNDVRDYSTTEVWIGFVSIISAIGFIVWLIYLLRFNVFKKYGVIHPLHGLVTFLLFFISTGVLVSFTFVHPIMESVRANMAYDDEEIVKDVNDINVKISQLEYNQLQQTWTYDTVQLVKTDTSLAQPTVDTDEPADDTYDDPAAETTAVATYYLHRYRLDSAEFYDKINGEDSVVKLTDSLYLVYNTPDYSFLSPYMYYKMNGHLLSDFEIFRKTRGHQPTQAERQTISRELNVLLEKYKHPHSRDHYGEEAVEADDTPLENLKKRYRINNIDNSIGHIMQKKSRWRDDDDLFVFIRVFYYVTLGISLLLFIFRHTTIRTFFLSILAGILLTILTALIFSFLRRVDGIHFLSLMIIYTFLFFIGSLTVWKAKKRKAVTGILLNLFVFIVTALPILMLGWYYEYKKNQMEQTGYKFYREPFDFEDYAVYAEVGGALLLLVLLATFISKAYRRWFSLPED
jgi:uncharacterized membrane protein